MPLVDAPIDTFSCLELFLILCDFVFNYSFEDNFEDNLGIFGSIMEFKPLNKLFRPWLNDQTAVNRTLGSRLKCVDVTNKDYLPFIYDSQHINFYVPFILKNEISNHCSSNYHEFLHNDNDNYNLINFMKARNQTSTHSSPALQCISSQSIGSNLEKSYASNNSKWFKRQRPKRFNCPHCHIAFSNNGQLKGHIRTHTGKSNIILFLL